MASKVIWRYFYTYLIFLACLVMALTPLYIGSITLFEQRELKLEQAYLQKGVDQMENQLIALSNTAINMAGNSNYLYYAVVNPQSVQLNEQIALTQLENDFQRLFLVHGLAVDYGLNCQGGISLTRRRIFLGESYYTSYLSYQNLNEQQWQDLLANAAVPPGSFIPEMTVTSADFGTYQALTWVCRMSTLSSVRPAGILYATVRSADLANLLLIDNLANQVHLSLHDASGKLLMENGQIHAGQFKTISCATKRTGIQVNVDIPSAIFADQIRPLRNILIINLILVAGIGLLLSLVFAHRNSKPVQRLLHLIRFSTHVPSGGIHAATEFDYIAQAVTELDHSIDSSAKTIDAQAHTLRAFIFERFLFEKNYVSGTESHYRQLREFSEFYPAFPAQYQLAVIKPLLAEDQSCQAASARLLQCYEVLNGHKTLNDLEPVLIHMTAACMIVVIPRSHDELPDWVEILKNVSQTCQSRFNFFTCMALSELFTGPESLHDAYAQAQLILHLAEPQYSLVPVWQIGNFPDHLNTLPLDYDEMKQLHQALLHGEELAAGHFLDYVQVSIHQTGDAAIVQLVFNNLRSVLQRVKLAQATLLDAVVLPEYHILESPDVAIHAVRHCCGEICSIIRQNRTDSTKTYANNICTYIDDNLDNPELYTKLVADHFSISEPTLQKIVRTAKGQSFFDYVECRRLEKARQLLVSSNLSIADIAACCGYSSINSFYKVFKRKSSMTPKELRLASQLKVV